MNGFIRKWKHKKYEGEPGTNRLDDCGKLQRRTAGTPSASDHGVQKGEEDKRAAAMSYVQ